jgi:pSer/pThr/pTyr-binding forkhead associated (FHA) protein
MFGQLIPAGGGVPVPLLKESVVIGRSSGCDVVVSSRAVSGRHCELNFRDGSWWVTDLESHNGTGVNGVKCSKKRVQSGDILCLPRMRFEVVYAAPQAGAELSGDDFALSVLNEIDAQKTTSTVVQKHEETVTPLRSDVKQQAAGAPVRGGVPDSGKPMKKFRGKLVPCGGGQPIALLDPELLIGRSRKADIRLKFPTVSGRHCSLMHEDGYWFVEDLSSSNGVRVNGERVDRRHLLPGDQLAVAGQCFTIEYTAVGEPPVDPNLTSKNLLEKAGLQDLLNSPDAPAWVTSHGKTEQDRPRKYNLDDNDPN